MSITKPHSCKHRLIKRTIDLYHETLFTNHNQYTSKNTVGQLNRRHLDDTLTMFKIVILLAVTSAVYSKSVKVGQTWQQNGIRKVYETTIDANAIPLFKREKFVNFEYPAGDQKIKGIAIKDMDNGLAEPSITSGGLGFGFVNIKLKSERGSGFVYVIEIYA